MIARPIGYYVHHHGAGHLARANAIAAAADGRVALLGTGVGASGVELADDRTVFGRFDGVDGAGGRPDALHYAPLDHGGIRSRVAAITRWIEAREPALMVVDVSVEVAMLARLASVPVVYVRLNGDRTDIPHLEAFRAASALLAPFDRSLEAPSTSTWVRDKTRYLPGITGKPMPKTDSAEGAILVVVGRGGRVGEGSAIAQAAALCPQWRWRVIGPCSIPSGLPTNLEILGWVEDAEQEIASAVVVVGGAGDGLVGSVLAADKPFICLPEERPFGEQWATARGLERAGAALVLPDWPVPRQWAGLIADALALPAVGRRRLHDPGGAAAAARWLRELAGPPCGIREQAA